MSRPITVAITSVRGGDAPSAGLVAAQMLRRQRTLDVRVVALASDVFADGVQSVHVADRVVVTPSLASDTDGFFRVVASLARQDRRLVLLPGAPADTLALAGHQRALARAGGHALLPRESQITRLPFPQTAAVRAPRYSIMPNGSPPRTRRRWRYPVVARWADGTALSVATATELDAVMERSGASPVLAVHEVIAGRALTVAFVAGDSGPAPFVAARPLSVSRSGAVWSAVTVADPALSAQLRRAIRGLSWRGPGEAHFALDGRGRPWFTGLVPGFPSWVSLAAAAGQDLVVDYVRLALGAATTPAMPIIDGLLLSRVSVDRPLSIDALRELAVQGEISHAAIRA